MNKAKKRSYPLKEKQTISTGDNRFKKQLTNSIMVMCSLLIGLLIVELALRFIAPHQLYSSLIPSSQSNKEQEGASFFPGIDTHAQFTVNEYGYRAASYFDEDRFGIMAIGGSTTYCIGVSDNETWPWLLENLLNEASPNQPFTVGNIGVPAFNSGNHWHQLNQIEPQFDNIKVVLMLQGVNDFARVLFLDDEYFPTSQDTHLYNRSFVRLPRRGKSRWYQQTELYMHLRDAYHAYQSRKSQRYTRERLDNLLAQYQSATKTDMLPEAQMAQALKDYEQNLHKIAELARERNIQLVWITQPVLWYDEMPSFEERISSMGTPVIDGVAYSPKALARGMDDFNKKLIEVAQQEDVALIDLAQQLPKDTTVFYDWCHYHKRGTSQVAKVIFNELRELLPVELSNSIPSFSTSTTKTNEP